MNASVDQATVVRQGEELDRDRLVDFLQSHWPDPIRSLEIQQFPSGYSNLTYALAIDQQDYVLRRPPFGNEVRSAHDMGREFRVLSKLAPVFAAAPNPVLYCDDDHVLGAPFYLMERRRGVILRGATPPDVLASDPSLAHRLCCSFVDTLAALHTVDFVAAGLGDLGRPDGYIPRQVEGWTRRYQAAESDDWRQMGELSGWLLAQQVVDGPPALIHNDFKYDNLVLSVSDLATITTVLDWEMATIGDPLMDLGSTLAYWVEPGDPPSERERAFGPTMIPGSLTRRQLVDRYAEQTQRELPELTFYFAYGLFKLAVIIQQIYIRYLRGHTRDPRFAELGASVRSLSERGCEIANQGFH